MSCALSALFEWALEWDDQDYTHSLRGSCINLKPYMFLNLKKHTLITKKGCMMEVYFSRGKPLSGKILILSLQRYSFSFFCVSQ